MSKVTTEEVLARIEKAEDDMTKLAHVKNKVHVLFFTAGSEDVIFKVYAEKKDAMAGLEDLVEEGWDAYIVTHSLE